MPELIFTVRWPDGAVEDCYSPSLVVHDHLAAGRSYSVAEFERRSTGALQQASERVRAAYGFPCSRAAASARRIRARAAGLAADAVVVVIGITPPAPTAATSTATSTATPHTREPRS